MKRVVVHEPGGAEQLVVEDVPTPEPGPGEVRVDIAASGVNFVDVYFRTGLYRAERPIAIGSEAAGTVSAVGPGVSGIAVGDRVAYAMVRGSYATHAIVPAAQLVKVPEPLALDVAAAALLQGMTAHFLVRSTFPVEPGHTCLVHAAAGGAGGLIVQMARQRGARVIGTVSTAAKAEEARALGCDEVINYAERDFDVEVQRLTGGRGVDVVYDSVGRATFDRSLRVLRPRGMLVLFGQSSGPVPPIDPQVLNTHGSLFLTRPTLSHYVATPEELRWRATELFESILAGALTIRIAKRYPLADAAEAHRDLESRRTTGKLLLVPQA